MMKKELPALHSLFPLWAASASHFIGDCFDCVQPYIDRDFPGLPAKIRFVSAQFYLDCHLTSESTLILIKEARGWDAEILARSVMEGTIKYYYMLSGNISEISRKVAEYWDLIPLFSSLKHSQRAKKYLSEPLAPKTHAETFTDLILADSDMEEILEKWPKQKRKSLEKSWSFSEILHFFSQSPDEEKRLLVHLAHGYGMSSHLLHKDADGIGMVWERSQREAVRRDAVTIGHVARIISDICTFARLRTFALLVACEKSTAVLQELDERYSVFFTDLNKAWEHFHETEYYAAPGEQGSD